MLHCDAPINVLQKVIEVAPDNLEVQDNRCRTPLFIAAWKGNSPDAVRVLLEAHPEAALVPNEVGDFPLHVLIESLSSQWVCDEEGKGHDMMNEEWIQVIRFLLDSYSECSVVPNRYGNSPFQELLYRWKYPRIAHDYLGEATYWVLRARYEVRNTSIDAVFSPLHALAGEEHFPLEIKSLRKYFFERYSENASVLDYNSRLPLHVAIEDGYKWIERSYRFNPFGGREDVLCEDSCIRDLFQLSPKAGKTRDITTRLYPFMAAAIKRGGGADLDTVFQLLKQHPYAARGLCSTSTIS